MQQNMSDLRQKVGELKWFHAIDFGEFASSGRFKPGEPQNQTLYGVFEFLEAIDFNGGRLLDIGTYDGIVAFGSSALGAKVDAVDTYNNQAFRLAQTILGISEEDVRYTPNVQIGDLCAKFDPKSFDVIVCAGVIYHMLFPMQAFTETRKILSDGGFLILETPYDHKSKAPILTFNGASTLVNEPRSYFIPTINALVSMANLCGFRLLAQRNLHQPKRVTLMFEAVTRSELLDDDSVAPFTKQMLKRDLCDNAFRYADLERLPTIPSKAQLKKEVPQNRTIKSPEEVVTFPYHYHGDKQSLGSTRFETPDGNLKKL